MQAEGVAAASGDVSAGLVQEARAGDVGAFAALVRHHDHGLRALAFRLLGDAERMEDALQEAYVKAFRGLPRFRGESSLGTWLYRIAYNACLDELKRARREIEVPLREAEAVAGARDPGEIVPARAALEAALAGLPPDERAVVLLVDANGFSYEDASVVLGVRAGTVASRLSRARAALRRALREPQGGEER